MSLTERMLWPQRFLEARGIPEEKAKNILVNGSTALLVAILAGFAIAEHSSNSAPVRTETVTHE